MELVKVDRERLRQRVEEALRAFPEVAGAYLFGSALDYCRPDSDLDLAIFFRPGLSERDKALLEGRIALRLEPLDGHPFDLTPVDAKDTLFAFRVLHEGVPLFVQDEETITDLMERVSREYAEVGYRYRLAVREVLEEAGTHADRP